MQLKDLVIRYELNELVMRFHHVANTNSFKWSDSLATIVKAMGAVRSVLLNNYEASTILPASRSKLNTEEQVIEWWLKKYFAGYDKRISTRTSGSIGTKPDPAVDLIILTRLSHLSGDEVLKIIHAHRLSMSAENVLGLFLEEYLALNLEKHGWSCAWGETLKSVDFCHFNGDLIQIKNRSNSENSSSSKVRAGTEIKKWYRTDANTGNYKWDNIQSLCGDKKINEENFRDYIKDCLLKNPGLLYVENDNPWIKQT